MGFWDFLKLLADAVMAGMGVKCEKCGSMGKIVDKELLDRDDEKVVVEFTMECPNCGHRWTKIKEKEIKT